MKAPLLVGLETYGAARTRAKLRRDSPERRALTMERQWPAYSSNTVRSPSTRWSAKRRRLPYSTACAGLGGRAYYLAGPSGTGKSTLAELIAREIADPVNIDELDATGLSAAAIQEIERSSRCRGLGTKPGRALIVNEAHGLNKAAERQLLTTLDTGRIPPHVAWLFTTTEQGALSEAFLSRCIELPMATLGLAEAFARRAKTDCGGASA